MKSLLTAAIILGLSSAAYAENTARWAHIGNWEIFSSSAAYCGMEGSYMNGHSLLIAEGQAGWILTISGPNVNVTPGKEYNVFMQASNGSNGTLVGKGYPNNTVLFPNLTLNTVYELARNNGFTVKGVGSFSLPGSAKAIIATHQCWQALSSAQTGEGI